MLYDEGFLGALAVIDADFDRITGNLDQHEGLIYSQNHDLDLDWARPEVIARYLAEVGEKTKCDLHGSPGEIIEKILVGLKPISVARLLNHCKHITYKLSDIDISACFANFSVDIDGYVASIFQNRPPVPIAKKEALKQQIARAAGKEYDLYQLTNGHDFHCALGASLRHDLGSRRHFHTWGSEVEKHLRLTLNDSDFKRLLVYGAICEWVRKNPPFKILQAQLS